MSQKVAHQNCDSVRDGIFVAHEAMIQGNNKKFAHLAYSKTS